MLPGSGSVYEGPQFVTFTVQVSTYCGVTISGGSYTVNFCDVPVQFTTVSNRQSRTTPANALQLVLGDTMRVSGTGYLPNSRVEAWIFSTGMYLGAGTTDSAGGFTLEVPIPASLPAGDHTVQLNGYTSSGVVRSASLGAVVVPPAASGTQLKRAAATLGFRTASIRLNATSLAKAKALAAVVPAGATDVRVRVVGYPTVKAPSKKQVAVSKARARSAAVSLRKAGLKGTYEVLGGGRTAKYPKLAGKVLVSVTYVVPAS